MSGGTVPTEVLVAVVVAVVVVALIVVVVVVILSVRRVRRRLATSSESFLSFRLCIFLSEQLVRLFRLKFGNF